MRGSRAITWSRLKVCFGALLVALFALGGLLVYASSLGDRMSGGHHGRSDLRSLGAALIALSVSAGISAAVFRRRLSGDE